MVVGPVDECKTLTVEAAERIPRAPKGPMIFKIDLSRPCAIAMHSFLAQCNPRAKRLKLVPPVLEVVE